MRNCDGASTTFAPAGSGKLKCRKCGNLFSRQGAKRHRNAHNERTEQPQAKPGEIPVGEAFYVGLSWGERRYRTRCPRCERDGSNHVPWRSIAARPKRTCEFCTKEFIVRVR